MRRILLLVILFSIVSVNAVHAEPRHPDNVFPKLFDGKKRGAVWGIGTGYYRGIYHEPGYTNASESGLRIALLHGRGIDERNLILLEFSFSSARRTVHYRWQRPWNCCEFATRTESERGEFFVGASWYHYLTRSRPAPLLVLGAGMAKLNAEDIFQPAVQIGFGYEFIKHTQILVITRVMDDSPQRYHSRLSRINLAINVLAY